jgi:small-conductance mechanosensitive channel
VRLVDASHVLRFTRGAIALLAWIVGLSAGAAWLTFTFDRFPYTRPWGEGLQGNLLAMLKQVALAIAEAMPGLVLVAVIFVLARFVVRALAVFFDQVEKGRVTLSWLDADTAHPTRRIFNLVVWLFALAMAYPYLPGAQTDAFKGLSVLVGIMVTVGGASVVGQAFSGLILMYVKAFRKGDFVRIGDTEGTVASVGMFATKIRTGLGEEVTLPNSGIMATTTKNYSRAVPGTGYVIDTGVTIGYSAPWRQVEAMLLEAARRTADIEHKVPPQVRQTALSDYYVEYRLIAYASAENPAQRVDVLSRLHANIQDVFNEYGVQILSPHYMAEPHTPQVVPKEHWYAAPARPPGK